MKKNISILIILYLLPFLSSAQIDSVEMTKFLNYFVKDYLPTQKVYKINNKVRIFTFSKTQLAYSNWYSIELRNDTSIFTGSDKNNFFKQLYTNADPIYFSNFISDSFLVDIDMFYSKDTSFKIKSDAIALNPELAKNVIEITTPYFFDNYNKCVIVSYIHNYSRQNSKLFYFKKEFDSWKLQKLLIPDFNIDY